MEGHPAARADGRDATTIRGLLAGLEALRPAVDERERASLERFRVELDRLAEPCSEAADPTHVTSSVVIAGRRGIVLHLHKRLGRWLQPGGHIEEGEHPADAALREAREETGLAVAHFAGAPVVVHVDAHDGPRGHFHLDLRYLLAAADADPVAPAGESPHVRWCSWDEVEEGDVAGLGALVRALLDVSFRPATAADAPAIAEVHLRSFREAHAGGRVRLAHPDDDVRAWARTTLLPSHDVTVAVAAGIVVGYAATAPGWLHQLYVDPAWLGRGVGSRLLEHATAALAGSVDLWTFAENARARAFYERHGFEAIAFGDGSGNRERQPDVRYRRRGRG